MMAMKTVLLVGTKKGAFILEGDEKRKSWNLRGPFCEAWPINHVVADSNGTVYAGGGNEWFGPAVWKSDDLGKTWSHSSEGLAYAEGEDPVKSVWYVRRSNEALYAGVEPAGLFRSDDDGISWTHIDGLQKHPSRPNWMPGGGGLILHNIVTHPQDDKQIWVAVSAGGLFHTSDGGKTWEPRNQGVRNDYLPEDQKYAETGQCVHSVVMSQDNPNLMYQQNHCGMYRSEDGGMSWQSIEDGLPSSFGFPSAIHPRDDRTLYLIPLNGDVLGRFVPGGKAAVWRTKDGGNTWEDLRKGLPQKNVFFGVLRQAMAHDGQDPLSLYFGTNTGAIFASADEGESWICIAEHMPTISSVETLVVED
jgi:photosystem II stability/assembly factor-like uncharacterized protein